MNCCLNILNKAVRSLSVMSEKNPSVREKESLWLGKVSFNFGLLVMKDNSDEESVDFMKRGMQLFYQWIESSSVRDNCSGALSKMNEVSNFSAFHSNIRASSGLVKECPVSKVCALYP